jgi:hypothetical protein
MSDSSQLQNILVAGAGLILGSAVAALSTMNNDTPQNQVETKEEYKASDKPDDSKKQHHEKFL